MRWIIEKKEINLEYRIKNRFILFPKTINGETRWLEICQWKQKYNYDSQGGSWSDMRWIDGEE